MGLDFSERSLDLARRTAPEASFHAGDMLAGYTHLSRFDAVLASACFVHLPDASLRTAFTHIAAVLKPGGKLLMLVMHGEGKQEQFGHAEVGGVVYDRELYAQTPELLMRSSEGLLRYEAYIGPGAREPWRWHLLEKV